MPNFSEFSSAEKDELIVRLFAWQEKQGWASSMIELLLEAIEICEATSKHCLAEDSVELASIRLRYDA